MRVLVNFRLSPVTVKHLKTLAANAGVSMTSKLESLIISEYDFSDYLEQSVRLRVKSFVKHKRKSALQGLSSSDDI